jgi:hypothetical protein
MCLHDSCIVVEKGHGKYHTAADIYVVGYLIDEYLRQLVLLI